MGSELGCLGPGPGSAVGDSGLDSALPLSVLGFLVCKWGKTAAVGIQRDSAGAAQCMPGTPQMLPYPDPRTMTVNTPKERMQQKVEVLYPCQGW